MTRIHRSVAASFSAVHFNTTNVETAVPVDTSGSGGAADVDMSDPMAALEAQAAAAAAAPKVGGFVSAGVQGGDAAPAPAAAPAVANPEELDIGDGDDDED
jgi:hypothetical protein